MLRYIIGITLITAGLILIRALSNGKILKKHQYALWLIIPAFMILFPLVKEAPVCPLAYYSGLHDLIPFS